MNFPPAHRTFAIILLLLTACADCRAKPLPERDAAPPPAQVGTPVSSARLKSAPPGPRLYVSNEDSNDVSVLDAQSGEELARIPVGRRPRGLRLSRDEQRLYVAVSGSAKAAPGVDESTLPPPDRREDAIAVVDLREARVVQRLASGNDPEAFDLSPDGATVYVSNEDAGKLSLVDVKSGKVTAVVPVGDEPEGVTVRPDGKVVYVTSEEENRIDVVDAETHTVVASIPTGLRPRAVVFSSDGKRAFVSNELSASIGVVDAERHASLGEVKLGDPTSRPMGLALSPDDKTLFVATGRGGAVVQIDVGRGAVERTVAAVGKRPWGLAIASDGKRVFTANGPSNDVSIVDAVEGKLVERVPAGSSPWGIVYARAAPHQGAAKDAP